MSNKTAHNNAAPYWAAALLILVGSAILIQWIDSAAFWNGYAIDMAGPAWNYILFRGLFTAYSDNAWRRFFTPVRTLVIFLFVCFGIEIMQFFNLYKSTYDPWDFLAYISILLPVFIIDLQLSKPEQ
ncbi:MAG: hypothetical protein IMF09_02895 [Proteobacteria bacterium]|nr:hypothetical protein [Pseudomonadota bacterium]